MYVPKVSAHYLCESDELRHCLNFVVAMTSVSQSVAYCRRAAEEMCKSERGFVMVTRCNNGDNGEDNVDFIIIDFMMIMR